MLTFTGVGRLGSDCEIRYTPGGMAVGEFSVAFSHKSKKGEETTWVKCVMFGDRVVALAPYILKGDRLGITGKGKNESWDAKDGSKKTTLKCLVDDVELMGEKRDPQEAAARQPAPRAAAPAAAPAPAPAPTPENSFDDDIPF